MDLKNTTERPIKKIFCLISISNLLINLDHGIIPAGKKV